MVPDLKRWEESQAPAAPKLLVVSTGDMEANRAMGLRSPVVLDESFVADARSAPAGRLRPSCSTQPEGRIPDRGRCPGGVHARRTRRGRDRGTLGDYTQLTPGGARAEASEASFRFTAGVCVSL